MQIYFWLEYRTSEELSSPNMDTSSSVAVRNLTLADAGSPTNSKSREMDAAALDEVGCPFWVPLTLDLMEGAKLGEAKGAGLGGAEEDIRLDAVIGLSTGTWAGEGGSPGGHMNGGGLWRRLGPRYEIMWRPVRWWVH
jgi:hypothetical protein